MVNTKNIDKYLILKEKYQDFLILIKSGNFYYTYLSDAFIIRYFFNYQIQGNRIGFPVSIKDKVIGILKSNNISVVEENSNSTYVIKILDNKYYEVLDKAKILYRKEKDIEELLANLKCKINENKHNYYLIKEYVDEL